MRDRATVEVALMAAETGHLVLSTLHTVDAGQSINRILGMFSLGEEQQLRLRLADTLRYIVSQRLAPKVGGGRQLLTEIMGHNLRTRETIALGESEDRSFYEIIEASAPFGWITFDQSILKPTKRARSPKKPRASLPRKRGRVTRGIDLIQKTRGIATTSDTGFAPRSARQRFSLGTKHEHRIGHQRFLISATRPRWSASITSNTRR